MVLSLLPIKLCNELILPSAHVHFVVVLLWWAIGLSAEDSSAEKCCQSLTMTFLCPCYYRDVASELEANEFAL